MWARRNNLQESGEMVLTFVLFQLAGTDNWKISCATSNQFTNWQHSSTDIIIIPTTPLHFHLYPLNVTTICLSAPLKRNKKSLLDTWKGARIRVLRDWVLHELSTIQLCTFHDGCKQGIYQQIFNRKSISRKITHPQSWKLQAKLTGEKLKGWSYSREKTNSKLQSKFRNTSS